LSNEKKGVLHKNVAKPIKGSKVTQPQLQKTKIVTQGRGQFRHNTVRGQKPPGLRFSTKDETPVAKPRRESSQKKSPIYPCDRPMMTWKRKKVQRVRG